MAAPYQKIARALMNEIRQGKHKPGNMLPRRVDLSSRFGVTRSTIDRSISYLASRGMVVSRKGSGTYVNHAVEKKFRVALISSGSEVEYLPDYLGMRELAVKNESIVEHLPVAALEHVSDPLRLLQYDGILWYLPYGGAYDLIARLAGDMPQIVLNRQMSETNWVAFDQRAAALSITAERLAMLPQAMPVFLSSPVGERAYVTRFRRQGFVDACRAAERFYEILDLPDGFSERVSLLDQELDKHVARGVLVVSNNRKFTGAFVAWAERRGLRWGRDVFYSDFDNRYEEHVWGMRVTTFLQDYARLVEVGLERMRGLLGGEIESVNELLSLQWVRGDT